MTIDREEVELVIDSILSRRDLPITRRILLVLEYLRRVAETL
jgi:hypothetical protein